MDGDVESSHSLPWLPAWLKLQRHLQLANCEVMAKIVGNGGDGAERVGGDGTVELGHAGGIQFPAHQLKVAQVLEAIWGVTQGQAGFAAGGVGGSPVVVGRHSLYGVKGRKDKNILESEE